MFKVHSKVTFQSCSTEHLRLMLNQAWWTHLAIFNYNMSHRKHVRKLESFFAPNRSQSESEKNDTEEEQCINQEETDEDRREAKKSRSFQKTWLRDHTWLRYEKEASVLCKQWFLQAGRYATKGEKPLRASVCFFDRAAVQHYGWIN